MAWFKPDYSVTTVSQSYLHQSRYATISAQQQSDPRVQGFLACYFLLFAVESKLEAFVAERELHTLDESTPRNKQ